jgi:hypothetical protein
MRLIRSSCVVPAVLIGLVVAVSFDTWSLRAGEEADLLKVNSVWQGTCDQSNPKSSYPTILFIKQRKGDTFEGVTWYPTLENGLIKITGRIDAKGAVTFTEEKVIHGEATDQRPDGVVAGSKYNANLERRILKGSGEYMDPETKAESTLKISLKLAE